MESSNQVTARKYETLARELKETQDQAINQQNDLEKKMRTIQNQNRSLQEEADEARTELSSLDRQHAHQLQEIETKHAILQKTLDDLRTDLECKSTALQTVQDRLSQRETEVGRLESEVLRLKAQTGDADTLAVIKKELSEQVAHIKKLEATNREQSAELKHFRKMHKAVEIVEEEKRLLGIKVRMVDDLQKEVREAQLQRQILEDEKKSWSSYLQNEDGAGGEIEFESPEALARALVQERLEKASLVDRLGAVQPEVLEKEEMMKSLEAERSRLQDEVDKLRVSGGSGDGRVRSRLERQRALAVKEVEYLREQLRTFDSEETTYLPENKFDEQKQKRIRDLEGMVDQYRIELQTLNDELSKREDGHPMTDPQRAKRPRQEADEGGEEPDERLGQLSRKNRTLQDDLSSLQHTHALLRKELAATQTQLASLQESSRTRILSLRSNPTADTEAIKLSTLASLRAENKALLAQLEGSPRGAKVVPISTLDSIRMEIKDMEGMVAEKEKSRLRLRQIYAMKSLEFREAIASLLGWEINVMPNGRFRMSSVFHAGDEDEDGEGGDAFIFDGENGTMKISGGPDGEFAREIQHLITYWVKDRGSIPALLAACTLEFVEKAPTPTPTKDLTTEVSGGGRGGGGGRRKLNSENSTRAAGIGEGPWSQRGGNGEG